MSEDDAMHGGSRWEPPPGAAPTAPTLDAPPPMYSDGGATPSRRLPGRLRRRVFTGAAAVALVAAGGVGGFATGQAASGDDTTIGGTITDDGTGRDGVPHGRPDFGGGSPPRLDDGGSSTDGGSTGDGTT